MTASLRRRVAVRYAAEGSLDISLAERSKKDAEKRFEDSKKTFQAMKSLKGQREQYGKSYGKLVRNGNLASVAAEALIRKYEDANTLKGKAKRVYNSGLTWLAECVVAWDRSSNDFGAGSAEERLANMYAALQKLEASIRGLPSALRGKEEPLDESWREH